MTDRFLPDYGLYLLNPGVRPETRLVFFDLPVDPLNRPGLAHGLRHPAQRRGHPGRGAAGPV